MLDVPVHKIKDLHTVFEILLRSMILTSTPFTSSIPNMISSIKDVSPDSFDVGFRAIKIVGSFGFSTSNPPSDLVHAICVYCSHLQRAKSNQGNVSITQRNSTVTLSPRTMPMEVREILRGYRNVSTIF